MTRITQFPYVQYNQSLSFYIRGHLTSFVSKLYLTLTLVRQIRQKVH